MKRTAAIRCLILAVIWGLVLALPGGLPVAADDQTPGCAQCQVAGHAQGSCPCCQHHDKPGHCGASGPSGMFACHCSASLACLSPPAANIPTWQVSSYCLSLVTVSTKLFPPNIFHPPEPSYLISAHLI